MSSWKAPTYRPPLKSGKRAAQLAEDADNFRTSAARVCTDTKIAQIGPSNIEGVQAMYGNTGPPLGLPTSPLTEVQRHQLPDDFCRSILQGSKKKASGATCDLLDLFIDLATMHIKEVNNDLHTIFDLIHNNLVPEPIQQLFTDTYLFCLYKDP